MVGTNMCGLCEALIFAHKGGISLDKMIDLLNNGAAGSFALKNLGPRIIKRDLDPGFYVEHFVKDLKIILEESERMNIKLPAT